MLETHQRAHFLQFPARLENESLYGQNPLERGKALPKGKTIPISCNGELQCGYRDTISRKKPLQILHLITTLDVGGAEVMLLRLLNRLDPMVFSSHVVCLSGPGEIGAQIASIDISVTYLRFSSGRITFRGMLEWLKILHQTRPQIIQSWMYHANFFALSAMIGKRDIPTIWNIQASGRDPQEFKAGTRGVMMFCRLLSGLPKKIIVNSQKGMMDHSRAGYRYGNLHHIPNGFDLSLFSPLDQKSKEEIRRSVGLDGSIPCVGMFARYHPVKDHSVALRAAAQLREKGVSVNFIFAGSGIDTSNAELMQWITSFNIEPVVHLLGYRRDMSRLMAAMDVVISCSHSEGLSNVIGEAMASGVPCVVTDVGDSSLMVGTTGKTVRPKDPEALAACIMELIRMPLEERKNLGLKARDRIRSHYSIERISDAYAALYLDALKKI